MCEKTNEYHHDENKQYEQHIKQHNTLVYNYIASILTLLTVSWSYTIIEFDGEYTNWSLFFCTYMGQENPARFATLSLA